MKKAIHIINIIMGSFTGVFIGHTAYTFWQYHKYPPVYSEPSFHWLSLTFAYGIYTLVLLSMCVILKAILKHIIKARGSSK